MAIGDPTNSTIAFGTTGFTGVWKSFEIPGSSRNNIDVTGVNTSGHSRSTVPAVMNEVQTIRGTIFFDPAWAAIHGVPRNEAAEVITITLPSALGGDGLTIVFTGFISEASAIPMTVGEAMSLDVTITISSAITGTATGWNYVAA